MTYRNIPARSAGDGSATARPNAKAVATGVDAGGVTATLGATLATATVWVAAVPVSLSLSVAAALTCGLAGPSANTQSKRPTVLVWPSTVLMPPVPQLVVTEAMVSAPGSVIV